MTITATTTPAPAGHLEPDPAVIDRPALDAFRDSIKNGAGAYVAFYRTTKDDGIRISQEQRDRRGNRTDDKVLIDLPVAAYVTAYENDLSSRNSRPGDTIRRFNAWAGISYPNQDQEWITIVRSLRIGDRIQLLWLRGNDSEAIRTRDCYRDELRLRIDRGKFRGASFLVDVYVGPDNTARMVRL